MNNTATKKGGLDRTLASFRAAPMRNASAALALGGPSIHALPLRAPEKAEPVQNVVLLIDGASTSWVAIHRAWRVSDALDARLRVILAIPDDAAGADRPTLVAHVSELLCWRSPRRGSELEVVRGSVTDGGLEAARKWSPVLVVVDARLGADEACRLVERLETPVLVARDARSEGEWIAASDMRRLQFPVLATARDLARSLKRDIVYFHNARPYPVFVGEPMSAPVSFAAMMKLQDDAAAAKRARLAGLADEDCGASLVTRTASTVDALLDLARDRDADMIVVGHRRRSWFTRILGCGTAARVASRSRRSVLVVPLKSAC